MLMQHGILFMLKKLEESIFLQLLLLFGIGFIFYWPSLLGGVTFIDDNGFIFESLPMINSKTPFHFWDRSTSYARSWPLSYTIFWAIYQFAKTNYWVYKLINLILHILNSYLIIDIFKRWFSKNNLILAALIYLIHPIQIETVSWIFQLNTILATRFFLLSYKIFLLYLDKKNIFLYIVPLYLFLFSLLSKISAILLPFLFLMHAFKKNGWKNYLSWILVAPFFLLSLFVGLQSTKGVESLNLEKRLSVETNVSEKMELEITPSPTVISDSNQSIAIFPELIKKVKVASVSFSYYIFHFFIPNQLSIIQSDITKINFKNLFSWIFSFLIFIFLVLNYFVFKLKLNQELFLSLFFIFAISPILGFVFIPFMNFSLVADHWIYLGMVPFAILAIVLLDKLKNNYKTFALILFFSFWSIQSLTYIHLFNHKYQLIERAIQMVPLDYRLHMELAMTLFKDKKLREAKEVIDSALKKPELANNIILLLQGAYFDRELDLKEELALKIHKLGIIYVGNRDKKNAKLMVEELKKINISKSLLNSLEKAFNSLI